MRIDLVTSDGPALEGARALMREYFRSWGMEDDVLDPDRLAELDDLPRRYGPPDGALLVGYLEEQPAGIVALKRHDERSCVMKRMFVRPVFQRRGLARALALELMAAAEELGYERMVLDTPGDNARAIALYRSLGFTDIEPYMEPGHDHIHEGWTYLAISLPVFSQRGS